MQATTVNVANINPVTTTIVPNLNASVSLYTSGNFGTTVISSLDGSVIAIGSPYYNSSSGNVQVYSNSSLVLNVNGSSAGDQFGEKLALSRDGKTLVIGSPNVSSYRGRFMIYSSRNSWANSYIDTLGTYANMSLIGTKNCSGDRYGYNVAVNADSTYIVTSTPYVSDTTKIHLGHVRIYKLNSNNYDFDQANGGQVENAFYAVNIAFKYTTLFIGSPDNSL